VQGGHPDHEAQMPVEYENHIQAEQAEEEDEDYAGEVDQGQDDQPIYDSEVVMDQEQEEAQIDDEQSEQQVDQDDQEQDEEAKNDEG